MKKQPKLRCGAVSRLIILFFLGLIGLGRAQTTVTNSDPTLVGAAIEKGGVVLLAFDGAVELDRAFSLTADTTVDASGHSVILNGNSHSRHFVLTNAVTLRLINLVLANGAYVGSAGATNQNGQPGLGGSIYSQGGRLELIGCKFMTNQALGGEVGPISFNVPGTGWPAAGSSFGGAIYCADGSMLITNCAFASNLSEGGKGSTFYLGPGPFSIPGGTAFGGAIYMSNSPCVIVQSTLVNNTATMAATPVRVFGGAAYGGAVYGAQDSCVISNAVFEQNSALGVASVPVSSETNSMGNAYGGAVFHESGVMEVHSTVFKTNVAIGGEAVGLVQAGSAFGGAVHAKSGTVRFDSCALIGNEANGGIALDNDVRGASSGGSAFGGAVYSRLARTELSFINSTLAGNNAKGGDGNPFGIDNATHGGSGWGGAIYGDASLLNTTLSSNWVDVGFNWAPGPPPLPPNAGSSIFGNVALTNSILVCAAGPSWRCVEHVIVGLRTNIIVCAAVQTNISGQTIDGGHNICSDGSPKFTSASSRGNLDPLLAPPADYGGFTPTCALLPMSPAIDAGDDSVCPATDQRGVPRPQGLHCDIGAFELAPKVTIGRKSNGVFVVKSQFAAGKANEILASTNLVDWVYWGSSFADTNGVSVFEDMGSPFVARRFYHVRPAP
jgi:hypothetical protein